MDASTVFQFGVATLLPVVAAAVVYQLQSATAFGQWPYIRRQALIGVLFGLIAILGTEFGIVTHDATMNVRDASPLVAGLLFGGPSGIIAGVIGGVERWFAALWGRGMYTRLACTFGTMAAGLYAALLRKLMFDDKKPTWPFALVIGGVVEVLHLTLVFVTNMHDVEQAYTVVRACSFPMIGCNALSVALATMVVTWMSRARSVFSSNRREISQLVQRGMFVAVLVAFVLTSLFTGVLQTNLSVERANSVLSLSVTDAESTVAEASRVATTPTELEAFLGAELNHQPVGESGRMLVADAQGNVLGAAGEAEGQTLESVGLASAIAAADELTLIRAEYLGSPAYVMYADVEGYRLVAIEPVGEANLSRNISMLLGSFMEVIIFALLFTVIYFLIKHVVVDNIREVNQTLGVITDGDLEASVEVRGNEEFSSLSDDINHMVDALKLAIAEAAARIDAELEYARDVQRSALPKPVQTDPARDGYTIYASMDAAREVGGDFFDYYMLDDNHLAFLVADVSGKGIPAAMFMMKAKTLIQSLAQTWLPVDEVFTRANDQLCEGNDAQMFVTAWMAVVDLSTGHAVFANAGHNPPALRHAGGSFAYQRVRPNLVLGGMDGIPYAIHELSLAPGDTLFLYTDGVTEATDAHNGLFGEDRLLATLDAHADDSVEEMCHAVHEDVDAFVGEAPQFDDITVLAFNYAGRE